MPLGLSLGLTGVRAVLEGAGEGAEVRESGVLAEGWM